MDAGSSDVAATITWQLGGSASTSHAARGRRTWEEGDDSIGKSLSFVMRYESSSESTRSEAKRNEKWPPLRRRLLVVRVIQTGKKGSEDFDAVPKILEAHVFVRGVLIVVVVGDGEGNHGRVVALLKKIHRQASARSW